MPVQKRRVRTTEKGCVALMMDKSDKKTLNIRCRLAGGSKERQSILPKMLWVGGLFIISQLLFYQPGLSQAADAASQRQIKGCGSLQEEDVRTFMAARLKVPSAKVLHIGDCAINGLCEVVFDNQGRMGVFYLTPDKKYLMIGPVWQAENMYNMTQDTLKSVSDRKRIDVSKISLKDTIVLGRDNAAKKVVVFTDPDCPFSSRLHGVLKQVVARRSDIAFHVKFYPLNIHRDAYWKAKSIVCNQSVQMLEDNFDKKEISKKECDTKEVDESVKLASSLGVTGTPTMILPDGRIRDGVIPENELTDMIDGKI